ncbi:MAG: zinc ribbon domain-containing protein [Chloroflexales bacterium]
MPLYEYQCPDCDTRFERLVRSSESAPTIACPTCGGERSARVLSMFATVGPRSGPSTSSDPACGPVG